MDKCAFLVPLIGQKLPKWHVSTNPTEALEGERGGFLLVSILGGTLCDTYQLAPAFSALYVAESPSWSGDGFMVLGKIDSDELLIPRLTTGETQPKPEWCHTTLPS